MMREGTIHKVDKLSADVGTEVTFDDVLLLTSDDKTSVSTDASKSKVVLEVLEHRRADKIKIIKFKRRKHHMKRMGHRQGYTVVKVKSIK